MFEVNMSSIAEIQNLVYPPSVPSGVSFEISYDGVNISPNTQRLFGYIIDSETEQQIPESYWITDVPSGSAHNSITIMSITQQFSGQIVLGHTDEQEIPWVMIGAAGVIIAIIATAYIVKKKK